MVMQVILLERIRSLGAIGDEVQVKDGYARNYLLAQRKALRANQANRERFAVEREEIEKRNRALLGEAAQIHELINDKSFIIIRQAGENGQLYGSVATRDIATIISEQSDHEVNRKQVMMDQPVKYIGQYRIAINLHPELDTTITINVARSLEEANTAEEATKINATKAKKTDEWEAASKASTDTAAETHEQAGEQAGDTDDSQSKS